MDEVGYGRPMGNESWTLDPLANDALRDFDNDRFTNIEEYQKGTVPNHKGSHP